MNTSPLVRVFLRGGVVSPADLLQIAEMARRVGSDYLLPGVRQDLLFPVSGTSPDAVVELLGRIGLSSAVIDTTSPLFRGGANNIASSYLAVNVVETTWWLKEAVYQRIFEAFSTDPRMRVNFVDPLQGIVPCFHGDLNFIASPDEHYWHLHFRIPGADRETLLAPFLVHSGDLVKVVRAIEERWQVEEGKETDPEGWRMYLREVTGAPEPAASEARHYPSPEVPCLEGFHTMASGQYSLGLYRREGRFSVEFLKALCSLCQETLVGKVAITPWKSLLVKGIRGRALARWEALMGEFGINVRHSSLELNWHIPVLDTEALDAKRRIVAELDRRDASMKGLTFTLTSSPQEPYFTSVVIEQVSVAKEKPVRYDVRVAAQFDPNLINYPSVASRVEEKDLAELLVGLSRRHARGEDPAGLSPAAPAPLRSASSQLPLPDPSATVERWIGYQCGSCLTVYEERYGAPEAGIDPGTPFADLSPEWSCSLCGSGREAFAIVEGV